MHDTPENIHNIRQSIIASGPSPFVDGALRWKIFAPKKRFGDKNKHGNDDLYSSAFLPANNSFIALAAC
jgi:hypothetical protein